MTYSELRKKAKRMHDANVEISGAGVPSKKSSHIVQSKTAKKQVSAYRELLKKQAAERAA